MEALQLSQSQDNSLSNFPSVCSVIVPRGQRCCGLWKCPCGFLAAGERHWHATPSSSCQKVNSTVLISSSPSANIQEGDCGHTAPLKNIRGTSLWVLWRTSAKEAISGDMVPWSECGVLGSSWWNWEHTWTVVLIAQWQRLRLSVSWIL